MRGHITKRGKDSYSVVVSLGKDPTNGKRKQQWVSVRGTKKDAEKRLAELLHQLDTGSFVQPTKTTLSDYLKRWLKDYACANLAPRTVEGYETIIYQHLIPKLGFISLTQLKPGHVQKYYADCLSHGRCNNEGGLNPLTVRHHHMVLHRALQIAMEWGLISRNPADAVKPPRSQQTEMQTMSEDNMLTFLKREHREKQLADRLLLGVPLKDDDLVFSRFDGAPLYPNVISRAWSNLAKKCGLKATRFHDARHSHASLMLKQGIHPKVVQERLGHTTIAVTLDIYSHVAPGLQESSAERFDEMLRNKDAVRV